ncbi:phosphogluconate dehydrogenase C-terminal domain-containing protein [Pararhodonellum marinum]|uniref:phosphogluconate dehydrogenase C-terminal domain-containing protein n=1 Tax=Pararhodonellum marinum TaxID=2755358 RepID=UPI00188EB3AA|nr:phosphogluconate dehydrogenase C-terminal domain-containing protein [Pararhodonellum marinum]
MGIEKLKVTLIGAGGKMGYRLSRNLKDHKAYEVRYIEIHDEGLKRMQELGIQATEASACIHDADVVIYAVPDVAIGEVTALYVPKMKKKAIGMFLDPAAPLAGHLAQRADISYFASHPCHPSVFNWEPDEDAHYDYFGGIAAKQNIVCALIQGPEEHYAIGEELAKVIYGPVLKSIRVTIEQMGILEPALSETFCGALITVLKEGADVAIAKGVPKEAVYEFLLGHINIELALLFGQLPGGKFSDAAIKAIEIGKGKLFKPDWKEIFEPDSVKAQIKAIT